jgi:signal transduction histidine kinase
MRRVMTHLQQGVNETDENIQVSRLVRDAVAMCSDRRPVPVLDTTDQGLWILGSRDRLTMALCHAIRNAQDATPADGDVQVDVGQNDGQCTITVRDTGAGMDERFIEERLFRPFDSTKGSQGMGIGAYQIRETIHAAGGRVSVQSQVEKGTDFSMSLPLHRSISRGEELQGVGV